MPGDTDPRRALGTLELELVLADLATIESQIEKRRKAARLDKAWWPRWRPWRRPTRSSRRGAALPRPG